VLHFGRAHGGLSALGRLAGLAVDAAGGPAALRHGRLRIGGLRLLGKRRGGNRHGGDAGKNDTTIHLEPLAWRQRADAPSDARS
jgi:hypothetical protein